MSTEINFPKKLPLVPLKDTVIFPQSIMSIYINDINSQKLVQKAFDENKFLFLSCLQEPEKDSNKVYRVGCVALIMRMKNLSDGKLKILVQGLTRASIESYDNNHACLSHFFQKEKSLSQKDKENLEKIKNSLKQLAPFKESLSHEILVLLNTIKKPGQFCDMLINNLDVQTKELQKILETTELSQRIEYLKKIIQDELEVSQLKGRLQKLIKTELPRPLLPSPENFKPYNINSYKKE